jgi:predicted ATP-grasp superfamily ATP-dependent carboligase
VQLISDRSQFERTVAELRREGFSAEDWSYQEALSVSPRHNVSICGWHDREAPVHLATRKVLQHPPKNGNGDVCEVIDPPPRDLMESAANLLKALDYRGPFELEFVFDNNSRSYKIIELNPRFWMQHGLVGAWSDEALVKRYLGMAASSARPANPPRYWINTIYALSRLARADVRVLYYATAGAICVPSWRMAVRWLPRFGWRFLRRIAGGPNK